MRRPRPALPYPREPARETHAIARIDRPEAASDGRCDVGFAINTLEYARRLREAGFSEQQAEGQAEALAAAMTETLATRQDLREIGTRIDTLERRLDARFDEAETRRAEMETRIELRHQKDIADLERRLTMRLGGIMVAGIGIMTALTRLT
jgi:hypothetical protein